MFDNANGGSVFNTPGPKRRDVDYGYLYRREAAKNKMDKQTQNAITFTNYLTDNPGRRLGVQDLGAIDKLLRRRGYPHRRSPVVVSYT